MTYKATKWRMLLATMVCYLCYYTGRQTFGFAIPGIEEELGISKTMLGWASAGLLWAYAVGQAINGQLGDRIGGRRMMPLGAVLSTGLNWVVSFGQSVVGIGLPWLVNGFAQSMGWAPGSRLISNWWSGEQRGQVYGLYVFAAGCSSVLAYLTSNAVLEMGLSWRWIFRGPVLLLFGVGILYYFVARDRPRDLGFDHEDGEPEAGSATNDTVELSESAIAKYKVVLSKSRFLFGCVAIGLQNLARYGLLVWVPVHFLGENWKEPGGTKWLSVFLPIGMAVGALANGWISDRVFHGNRSKAIVSFLSLAAVSSLIMWMLPVNHPLVIPALFTTGFFVYGPQASFWALCPDTFGTQRAGTATGVMNFFAYLFAGAGEPLIGWLIDSQGNTAIVFIVVAGATTLSALFALVIKR
ncbi:MAG: MFS transporter [Verrucomicrobiaceae bacterium]|jgi:MFS transporter, OPA family, glycerol-3-phosphate transporter|nr:MFS transporter [Verrucomicrobiaceae bacterium]